MEKSYEKVIEYVKHGIGSGEIQAGEKLLPERELAQKLEISRNSAREGLRILENMGVLESQQGAGNYVSGNFDEILAEMLSFMYILKKIDVNKITEFRSTEWGGIETGVKQATEEQRQKMMSYLDNLERAETEEERVRWDKAIHYLLIEHPETSVCWQTIRPQQDHGRVHPEDAWKDHRGHAQRAVLKAAPQDTGRRFRGGKYREGERGTEAAFPLYLPVLIKIMTEFRLIISISQCFESQGKEREP